LGVGVAGLGVAVGAAWTVIVPVMKGWTMHEMFWTPGLLYWCVADWPGWTP
jgi:hypothetical protein